MGRNTDIVRGGYEAFAAHDVEAVFARFAPDIEWVTPAGSPADLGGVFKGHAEISGFFGALVGVYGGNLALVIDEYVESGDRVVAFGSHHARSASGEPFTVRFAHSWTLVDGLATRFEEFFDTVEMTRLMAG